ncbi:SRPBCC family protein [Shewanella sp. UCD-KL12]|uniref:SRPBCC family protein n=1 Tax=Shewanella sp. UCD-KL12 TaxID=1917163 RepID=UPI000970CBE1|nr:SRPBCC family protein [Shewanella sp. UCD-KL12]
MEHQVSTAVKMNVSAEKVWGILDDFAGVEKFSIGVKSSPIIGDKRSGLSAKRHCQFYDDTSVVEEIIEYEAGTSFKVVLTEFTMPMKTMYAGFKVIKLSETSCEVSMYMTYKVKYGLIGALLGLMMRSVMKGVQKKLLSGLAHHAFTGKNIGSELPTNLAPALLLD